MRKDLLVFSNDEYCFYKVERPWGGYEGERFRLAFIDDCTIEYDYWTYNEKEQVN
jgi:hypothetical protein